VRHLVLRERIGFVGSFISLPQIPAQTQCGIGGQQFVLDRLRQNRAERPDNTLQGPPSQPLRATRSDQLATVLPVTDEMSREPSAGKM
jgi:hypothetical protein